jgi:hypothetical protein
MKDFLRHITLFILPFILLLIVYVAVDPFMLYWKYDNLSQYGSPKRCVNDAYRAIKCMDLYEDSIDYNSFIIGSSRSEFYYIDEWKRYIGEDAQCIHFGQSNDNLLGTYQRICYLDERYDEISNLLIIMDSEYLSDVSAHKGHLFRQPWQVTDENDLMAFNIEFLRAFYSWDILKSFFSQQSLLENELPFEYNMIYNETYKVGAEQLIESNWNEYVRHIKDTFYQFYERNYTDSIADVAIHTEQYKLLKEIAEIMKRNHTVYRIVISPLYDQVQLNPNDLSVLHEIFGKENVFDFSGVNEFTNEMTNYYETSHYRPKVCKEILRIIYDGDNGMMEVE